MYLCRTHCDTLFQQGIHRDMRAWSCSLLESQTTRQSNLEALSSLLEMGPFREGYRVATWTRDSSNWGASTSLGKRRKRDKARQLDGCVSREQIFCDFFYWVFHSAGFGIGRAGDPTMRFDESVEKHQAARTYVRIGLRNKGGGGGLCDVTYRPGSLIMISSGNAHASYVRRESA